MNNSSTEILRIERNDSGWKYTIRYRRPDGSFAKNQQGKVCVSYGYIAPTPLMGAIEYMNILIRSADEVEYVGSNGEPCTYEDVRKSLLRMVYERWMQSL